MKKIYFTFFSTLLFVSFSAVAQTPYAHYPLDGNANDVSGNNLNGAFGGSPASTTNRDNLAGKALDFNGTSDYIDLPSAFDFPSRTVLLWFNASQIGSISGYNAIYNSDGPHLQHGMTNIDTYDDPSLGNGIIISCDALNFFTNANTNQWYQVAVTRTPSVVKYYLNGVMVFTQNNPNGGTSANAQIQTAVVGADRAHSANFNGKIDDLLIYNTALTDAEITGNYTSLKDVHAIDEQLSVVADNGKVMARFSGSTALAAEILSVTLTDITGRIIAEKQGAYTGVMNETELPAGTYFVSVAVNDAPRPVTRKVVVAK